MPTYRGDDTGLIFEQEGVYMSPDGVNWSNMPYTKEQREDLKETRRRERMAREIYEYCVRKKISYKTAHDEIALKKSGLSARCKKFLIEFFQNIKNT